MKKFCQLVISALAALIAASPFNCSLVATVTVTHENENMTLASSSVPVTSASDSRSTTTIDSSGDYMTISITNVYETQLSLSFDSNADDPFSIENSSTIILPDTSSTQYAFPTEWAGRIYVEPNTNSMNSKIEDSFTGSFDIDVSYVYDYSVLITCSSESTAVFDCNIDLFKQSGIICNNQIDDSVCLNFAQKILDESASSFFTSCAGAAYIYLNDNEVNVSNLKSNLISCCIDTFCKALSRQLSKRGNSTLESFIQIRNAEPRAERTRVFSFLTLSSAHKIGHHHHSSRFRVHEEIH